MSKPKIPTNTIEYDKLTPMAKVILIENSPEPKRLARASIKLDETPVTIDDFPTRDGICRSTNMTYTLCYSPIAYEYNKPNGHRRQMKMNKPFQISCDLLYPKSVMRLVDFEDMKNSDHPVAKWLMRNTNISKTIFELAEKHPYMRYPFCIDYSSYIKKAGDIG